ncbi:Hypothetical protein SMAX5B_015924 [Scophthalmus maximus]|uniref:Uncharacterized protein n=1 Tax=Scophthalmus maximus TaxID=52904 RepID=A0A2U9CXD4_SCOMX|nr:Hypothetical protein SMAX5B_015924 [Scophthalmus maximus]
MGLVSSSYSHRSVMTGISHLPETLPVNIGCRPDGKSNGLFLSTIWFNDDHSGASLVHQTCFLFSIRQSKSRLHILYVI